MIGCLMMTFAFALSGLLVYLYFLRRGQFDDPEDVKYQMFREEDDHA